ncbi:MAG: leucyl aminopeptidase [Actinobacteria bacterium]|nr:leucyl aminopeptidase [Actinomycetota bacterium]
MTRRPNKLVPADFTPIPSQVSRPRVRAVAELSEVEATGHLVPSEGAVPAALGISRAGLAAAGFDGKLGTALVIPRDGGPELVAVGAGDPSELTVDAVRDLAAAFARATAARSAVVGLDLSGVPLEPAATAQAAVEGVLLARYRYNALRSVPKDTALAELQLTGSDVAAMEEGAEVGTTTARAAAVARDLTNSPAAHLTASDMAATAVELGQRHGFSVRSYDLEECIAEGFGGLLGVNRGSVEEPRMIVLTYVPDGEPTGHLALVGKGIMYDSGGISLKPSDPMHLLMKTDMGGAGSILGAFTALRDLGVTTRVTGYLSCTDNVPSGDAYVLGDVLYIRGGKTVEVKNTDAEGRLVMADALVLATEQAPDAIVDIATLTGATLVALGPLVAPLMGNNRAVVAQIEAAAEATGEPVWELPLEKRYRKLLDSDIADISNLGGPHAGSITAALFLSEFVGDVPWGHLDVAGAMHANADDSWRSAGATGFGARLLVELARNFAKPD